MAEGLFAQLEAQGRVTDTEIASVPVGAIVLPREATQHPQSLERFKAVFESLGLDVEDYIVTPEKRSFGEENVIDAHLTNGELVLPEEVFKSSPEFEQGILAGFEADGQDPTQYIVGHPNNRINPETGLPEFWFWVAAAVIGADIVSGGAISDPILDAGESLLKGVEDVVGGVVDIADDVIQNPLVRTAVSVINPTAGAVLNAYATLDSGESLSPAQIASLGIAGADLAGFELTPDITRALESGVKIAEGQDPLAVLVSEYGGDFVDKLDLGDKLETALIDFDPEVADFVRTRMDINQAAADLITGQDTSRILANQFGDEIANYLGSGDPNLTALGFAGIETGVALDQGYDPEDALAKGTYEYITRDGKLPDLTQLAGVVDVDFEGFDFNKYFEDFNMPELVGDFGFGNVLGWAGDLLPEIDLSGLDFNVLQGQGWDIPSLADLGLDLGQLNFEGVSFPELGLSLPDLSLTGIDLGDINFEGVRFPDLGLSIPEISDLGLNLDDLDFSGLNFADLGLDFNEFLDFGFDPNQFSFEGVDIRDIGLENALDADIDLGNLKFGDFDFNVVLGMAGAAGEEEEEIIKAEKDPLEDIDIVDPTETNLLALPAIDPLKNPLLA